MSLITAPSTAEPPAAEPPAAAASSPPLDINQRIAAQVRRLRMAQGLSLEALAGRCDVSRSMLSLIERGESSPTAVVLEKIATGLGVVLASLFDGPTVVASPVSRSADRSPWRDPQTGYVRCNISPSGCASPIQIVEVQMPPQAQVAYESGTRDAEIHQQIWVQQGSLEVTVGSEVYALATGDCLAMKLDAPTRFYNPTEQLTHYVVVIAQALPSLRAGLAPARAGQRTAATDA